MQEGQNDLFQGNVFAMLANRKSAQSQEDANQTSVQQEKDSEREILRKKENQVRARSNMPSEFSRMSKDRD